MDPAGVIRGLEGHNEHVMVGRHHPLFGLGGMALGLALGFEDLGRTVLCSLKKLGGISC